LEGITLEINSIGCKECRADYHKALKIYFEKYSDKLCNTCLDRLVKNPMRILDCKCPTCKEIAISAPKITDYLCENCNADFEKAKEYLKTLNIKFTVNPSIVRGLDYYNGLVFEFISSDIGAQGTVAGGGRYNGLSKELSDIEISGLGFAMGLERLILLMEKQNKFTTPDKSPTIFIASLNDKYLEYALLLTSKLRKCNISAECDINDRTLKAQMKYANKIGAEYVVVIGDNEVESGIADIKNMNTGEVKKFKLENLEVFLSNTTLKI
ncbi:MAG: histidine--tRNA ligase, partial [Clostridia bacterium]